MKKDTAKIEKRINSFDIFGDLQAIHFISDTVSGRPIKTALSKLKPHPRIGSCTWAVSWIGCDRASGGGACSALAWFWACAAA